MRSRFLLPLLLAVGTLTACDDDDDATGPLTGALPGIYVADVFIVRPTVGVGFDVLRLGGTLILRIDDDYTTSGELIAPGILTGGATFASLDGFAVRDGSKVLFFQDENTFVRDFEWTLTATGLTIINKFNTDAIYTVNLRRLHGLRFLGTGGILVR